MKITFVFFMIIFLSSCSAQKNISSLAELKGNKSFKVTNCPKDGSCSLRIIKNKTLDLKKDEFGMYYGQKINSNSILLEYTYERNKLKNTVDSHYSETIYFSIPKTTESLMLIDKDLQKVSATLHRLCYCKGTTGYFKITKGNLSLNIKKNELTLNADLSIKNIPIVLNKIGEKISLVQ